MMQAIKYGVELSSCNHNDLITVKNCIAKLCLDDNSLSEEQFVVAKYKQEIFGFGRLRTYEDCQELCSLGLIEPERMKGIGRLLTHELIQKSDKPLFVVTVIPDFFEKFSFEAVGSYPMVIGQKMEYCIGSLWVPEPYVAMKLVK